MRSFDLWPRWKDQDPATIDLWVTEEPRRDPIGEGDRPGELLLLDEIISQGLDRLFDPVLVTLTWHSSAWLAQRGIKPQKAKDYWDLSVRHPPEVTHAASMFRQLGNPRLMRPDGGPVAARGPIPWLLAQRRILARHAAAAWDTYEMPYFIESLDLRKSRHGRAFTGQIAVEPLRPEFVSRYKAQRKEDVA